MICSTLSIECRKDSLRSVLMIKQQDLTYKDRYTGNDMDSAPEVSGNESEIINRDSGSIDRSLFR